MRVKNVNLEWYVLNWNYSKSKIINYNILEGLKESIAKEVKSRRVYNKSILREYLKTQLMYYYWSKAEHEFYISDLQGNNYEKIDMWRQIEPNLDNIVEYINLKMELNFE